MFNLHIKTISRSIASLVLEKSGCPKSCLNLDLALFLYYNIENIPIYQYYCTSKCLPCFCLCSSGYGVDNFSIWSLFEQILSRNFVFRSTNSQKSTKNEIKLQFLPHTTSTRELELILTVEGKRGY